MIERIEDHSMPPEEREHYPRLASSEVETLKAWVSAGAAPFREAEPADSEIPPPVPLAVEVQELFREHCRECHRPGNVKNGIKILNHDLLVEKRKLVVPGEPDASPLYRSLITTNRKKRMPPPGRLPLEEAEISLVKRWIEAGAPPFPLPHK